MLEEWQDIVVIGNGMLARAWRELLEMQGAKYAVLGRDRLDLSRPETVEAALPDGVRTVVNCAAYTDVDGCETNAEYADAVNGHGVAALAARCHDLSTTLVHYSTDYVFDGKAVEPYRVDHAIHPINAYGRSKALGERGVRDSGCLYRLIRTSWLYAPWGKNFVRTMAKLTAEKDALQVVDDQAGRPTSSEHLARVSHKLLHDGDSGTYHVTDGGSCTWYEFTVEIAKQLGHRCDVQPCSSAQYPRPAKRPAYSVLDLSRTEAIAGAMPPWEKNLAAVLPRLER